MSVLDSILTEELVLTPTTVSVDYYSPIVDLMNRENECSFQTVYENGVNVNMVISLEVSNDGVNFSEVTDSDQVITDPSGSDFIDVFGTGANYARIKILVNAGTIELQRITYMGKRRH